MAESESPRIRRWVVRFAVAALLAGGALLLRATVLAPDPVPVRIALVEKGVVESTVTNSQAGTIRARRRSHVTAETGGRVVGIAFREGDRVKQGEVLMRLNDASARAQLELALQTVRVAEARFQEACLARDRAGRELARKRKLADEQIVSEDLLDQLEFAHQASVVACDATGAERDKAHSSVRAAEAELAKTRILAPFDGVVAEVSTEVGEWVTPSPPLLTSPAVVDLIDPTSFYVSAPMDEVDSGRIRPGQRAKLSVDSRPGEEFSGRVVRVAPYVLDLQAQNRTVEIEVEFDDSQLASAFLPGTSADVEVVLEEREGVLRVPTSALLEGSRVLVLEEGVLVERSVELGLRNWDFAELQSGLGVGAGVVVSLDRLEVTAGARAVVLGDGADPGP
jgi:HlyD family secretion protein